MVNKALKDCHVYIQYPIQAWKTKEKKEQWSREKISSWIKNAGGKYEPKFDESTITHFIVDKKGWEDKPEAVAQVLAANEKREKKDRVLIVNEEWLDSCLLNSRRPKGAEMVWKTAGEIESAAARGKGKKRDKKSDCAEGEDGGDETGEGEDESGSRNHQALLGEVFEDATESWVEAHDRRIIEEEKARAAKERQEQEQEEAKRKDEEKKLIEQQRKDRAVQMKRTLKKGEPGREWNKKWHIYKDSTGFCYDVMLTKVDTLTNTNERINLTIFESNTKPHSYATNCHFAGTGQKPRNNIIAAIGSALYAATCTFRKAFYEQTGTDWDDRIKAHNQRVADRGRDAETPGLLSARRGEEGDIKSKTRADEDQVPFDERKFEYMPPLYSARGWLPDGKEEKPEIVKQAQKMSRGRRDRVEEWTMSGANGSGVEDAQASAPIDLTDENSSPKSNAAPCSPRVVNGMDHTNSASASGGAGGDPGSPAVINGTGLGSGEGPSDGMGDGFAGANDMASFHMDNLLNGPDLFGANDDPFDANSLDGQDENFNFGQDITQSAGHAGAENNASQVHDPSAEGAVSTAVAGEQTSNHGGGATDFLAGAQAYLDSTSNMAGLPIETQFGQTQLATKIGEELLNFGNAGQVGLPSTGFPETENGEPLEDGESSKRKRDGEVDETVPAAKRVEVDSAAT